MSNKLEAALGGEESMRSPFNGLTETEIEADRNAAESRKLNSFTDDEGEVFSADASDSWNGDSVITLSVLAPFDDEPTEIVFYKADAAKIIALIAEAAK